MLRDRSSIAIGIVLPVLLILLFGYGLSLDVKNAPVAVVIEDPSPTRATSLAGFQLSPYFTPQARALDAGGRAADATRTRSRRSCACPATSRARWPPARRRLQLVVHGTDATTARIIQGYVGGAIGPVGGAQRRPPRAGAARRLRARRRSVGVEQRLWFNEANDSPSSWCRA